MFVRAFSKLACFALFLATFCLFSGCPSTPKPTPQITQLDPISAPRTRLDSSIETVMIAGVSEPNAPIKDRADAVLPEEALQLPAGRLPFSHWGPLCGFTEMRTLPNTSPPAFDLVSTSGTLTLYLGQRYAKWNGINLGLGFAPMPEGGLLVVHSTDVLKNFYPLALGALSIPKADRTLVLDPGHGGADPGSRSISRKAIEKDLALDWALRVERILASRGWRVALTRRDDRDISLLDRVAIADANDASLFISLHFNSLETSTNGKNQDETGIETYCLTPAGAPSNVTRNFEDDLRRVYPNNEFDAQNVLLANRIQATLVGATGGKDRGVRRARFMTVLREQKRPAVLVEGGFLSNPSEVASILKPEYRERLAQAVCDALPK